MRTQNLLFHNSELGSSIDGHQRKLLSQIDSLQPAQLLPADDSQICAHFIGEFRINPIELHEDKLVLIEPHEVEVEQFSHDWGRNYTRIMLQFRFELPFEGDAVLLKCCPSQRSLNPPCADVEGHNLVFIFHREDRDAEALKRELQNQISRIKQYLEWQRTAIDAWNAASAALVQQHVSARRAKLTADKDLVAGLGFAVRRRGDPPTSYTLPIKPKQVVPPLPAAQPRALSKPDPVLDNAIYEEILDTLADMSVTMERCPSAFTNLDEESLRMQFLIPLNGKFQGKTSGETFNAAGKTDILVKHGDRILFIAECKFWKGAQSLTEAIDQLLSYLTWRETKAAILLFNRNKDFSAVVAQIPGIFSKHPQYIRTESYSKTTGFRFIVRSSSDSKQHLTVTILAFDVPT